MRPGMGRAWARVAVCCLPLFAPGCVIRRGFVVQFDWSLRAHRTGCRQPLFPRLCRGCESPACEAVDGGQGCESCGHPGHGGFRRVLRREVPPPPAPEPPAPASFHPIPTRPVFGSRAEEPDAYEVPLRPMAQEDRAEDDSLDGDDRVPAEGEDMAPDEDELPSPENQSAVRLHDPRRKVRAVAFRAKAETIVPVPECRSCTVRFKE
jgi:hypothetical protein